MSNGFYKIYAIAIMTICTLFNLSSCSQSSGTSSRGWGSGYSSGGGWSSGGGHK